MKQIKKKKTCNIRKEDKVSVIPNFKDKSQAKKLRKEQSEE